MNACSTREMNRTAQRPSAAWIPTVYFAEGLPFYTVNYLALFFFQKMGVSNAANTLIISLLALPWTLKPLWSPFLELYKTKKFFVVLAQLLGGLLLVLIALSLNLPNGIRYSIALFAVLGFCSATHDIATDGIYIASLSSHQQAAWIGWQGAFYNLARVFCTGGLIWLAGFLTDSFLARHVARPVIHAWMIVFALTGAILLALSAYHARMLPRGGEERATHGLRESACEFWNVVESFCKKPHVWFLLFFIFLYRIGEGQVIKVGPLFLQATRADGGMGLDPQRIGEIYGVLGSLAFLAGSVLGGAITSKIGLKRALPWLVLTLNLPMFAYWYLSVAMPESLFAIAGAMTLEMFGYGFGFVGVILLMMQEIAPGKYQTAHYAFANSLMNLGLILPGAVSGWIQSRLGYSHFFLWVVFSTMPALFLSRMIPMQHGARPEISGRSQREQRNI